MSDVVYDVLVDIEVKDEGLEKANKILADMMGGLNTKPPQAKLMNKGMKIAEATVKEEATEKEEKEYFDKFEKEFTGKELHPGVKITKVYFRRRGGL